MLAKLILAECDVGEYFHHLPHLPVGHQFDNQILAGAAHLYPAKRFGVAAAQSTLAI